MRQHIARAPAKVNLQLSVGPLQDDGYHDLVTVFHAVALFDEVHATAAEPGEGISLSIVGSQRELVPVDSTNLAWRAAQALADHAGVDPDVHLRITKGIPVAGGMAGGSADAAAALVACDSLWGLRTPRATLMEIAATLGSDIPFSLHGGTAIGTGRGEILTPVLTRSSFWWVFALADGGLSTPAVYAECDRLRAGSSVTPPMLSGPLMSALRSGDVDEVAKNLNNDLERPAVSLRPSLSRVLGLGEEYAALRAMVSGSGPTCAFLARDGEHALDLSVALSSSGLCRTVVRAAGPVPGASLV
jgi:4-diphosphocytidyl-2-C-methyl-D-erythritol kinase